MTIAADPPFPPAARWLGFAGLIPFVFGVLAVLFGQSPEQMLIGERMFVVYSAVILSFLGGVRWGAALGAPTWRALLLAVGPSLIAFGALLIDRAIALPLLALAFVIVGAADAMRRPSAAWPEWFRRLRLSLSIGVVALHVLMLYALDARAL